MHLLNKFKKKGHNKEELKTSVTQEEEKDSAEEQEESWISEEGQLAVDVYETRKQIVIKSTIAGVESDDLDISLHNDMITIRGKRERDENIKEEDYLYQECYWGSFSRSIILPADVDAKNIDATLENGILTITLTKTNPDKNIPIKVR